MATFDIQALDTRMRSSIDALKREFQGLRTGRASANLLDPVQVSVYGSRMPLNQLATVSVPEARMIAVQVWDRTNVQAVDKAIREANLGINPIMDGTTIAFAHPYADGRSSQRARETCTQVRRTVQSGHTQRPPRRHGSSQKA